MVDEAALLLPDPARPFKELGTMLREAWAIKKELAGPVSNPAIDGFIRLLSKLALSEENCWARAAGDSCSCWRIRVIMPRSANGCVLPSKSPSESPVREARSSSTIRTRDGRTKSHASRFGNCTTRASESADTI